jgi:prepilin-type N-terminal cleavage/methylation domain-containing protein
MKPSRTPAAFTLIELLVVISIIAILASLAIPAVTGALVKGQLVQTMNNGRQIQLATQMMTLDTQNAGGDGLEWTSTNSSGGTEAVSLSVYFAALTNNNYLTQADLRKVLSAPGKAVTGATFGSGNIAFKIFEVNEQSPSDQVLLVTANWAQGGLTSDAPYAKKGFVFYTKSGEGGMRTRPQDAPSTTIFPKDQGHTSYNYNTLQ